MVTVKQYSLSCDHDHGKEIEILLKTNNIFVFNLPQYNFSKILLYGNNICNLSIVRKTGFGNFIIIYMPGHESSLEAEVSTTIAVCPRSFVSNKEKQVH